MRPFGKPKEDVEVVVRRYQLRAPMNWGPDCDEQLRLQTVLWNRLVEIEREHQQAVTAIVAEDPDLAALQEQQAPLRSEITALQNERKALRQQARKKIPTPEIDARISEIKKILSKQADTIKQARRTARDRVRDRLSDLERARRNLVKVAYKESHLWWGNYNAVIASYERARTMVFKTRVRGEPAELKFHRWRGEGRLTNQIQGGMPVDWLFTRRHSQVQVDPIDEDAFTHPSRGERRRLSTTTVSATVYTTGAGVEHQRRNVSWPIWLSRPIPEDATIKEVVVTRRRVASQYRWHIVFTATKPREARPEPSPDLPAVAIDLGWRRVDYGLRVATIVTEGSDGAAFVLCPNRVLNALARCDDIQATRDAHKNEILPWLLKVPHDDAPPELAAHFARLNRQSSIDRIAALATAWHGNLSRGIAGFEEWRSGDCLILERWRRLDKRLWEIQEHTRDKFIAYRTDVYRKAARAIVESARVVILEDFNLARAAKLESTTNEENPLHQAARHNRQIAAPNEFRRWIEIYCDRLGVPVHRHKGESNRPHFNCGTKTEWSDPTALLQRCPKCNQIYDVDINAAEVMLAAWKNRPPEDDEEREAAE